MNKGHDGNENDTWAPCPWCGEEYSQTTLGKEECDVLRARVAE